ncbi:MAG: UvrD-helicase domain-containing protein [Lachnospiraceae bacterium]|nr:UvrD-helicase domain-containing protein [Lachnospiraceae bacterium]
MFDLSNLNNEQQQAVTHFTGPLLILAGAGSGKTRVITHRIAYLIAEKHISPYQILALTFTNKAAGEMKERVRQTVGEDAYKVTVSTFHSFCVRVLRYEAEYIGYTRNFVIYDSDDQRALMRNVIKELNLDAKKNKERTFLSVVSSAKDKLQTPADFRAEAEGDFQQKNYCNAYELYQKKLKEANAMDFDDLIFKTVELFEKNPDVLQKYQNRYRFIMVDEYQDTNYSQFKLISLMAKHINQMGETERNLCVVGDDDQSIYKFRGADIKNILNFEDTFENTRVIKLEQNYRSTSNILDAANAVIKHNFQRKEKVLRTEAEEGDLVYYRLFENDLNEGYGVSEAIETAVKGGHASYSDFAVLYRTNAQSRALEESMVRLGIPYKIVGGVNFYQRKEIKDILAYLRVIDNPADSVSINRIINVPKRGIGNASIDKINQYSFDQGIIFYDALAKAPIIPGLSRSAGKINDFFQIIEDFREMVSKNEITISGLIKAVMDVVEYDSYLQDTDELKYDERMENIEELIAKAHDYEENEEDPTLSEFLADISLVTDLDNVDEEQDLVLLMTLHSAKGLEFPYVYIVGMENNLFPSYMALNPDNYANGMDELEEERRLAYVGITRAEKKLALSSVISRFRNGDYQFNSPSQFLSEIPDHLLCKTNDVLMPFGDAVGKTKTRYSNTESAKRPSDNDLYSFKSYKDYKTNSFGSFSNSSSDSFKNSSYSSNKSSNNNPFEAKVITRKNKKAGANFGHKVSVGNSSNTDFNVGDLVSHPKFGKGTITEVTPKGNDKIVTVIFEGDVKRKLVASLSGLTKI